MHNIYTYYAFPAVSLGWPKGSEPQPPNSCQELHYFLHKLALNWLVDQNFDKSAKC